MPREITDHGETLEAIRNSGVLSELVEEHNIFGEMSVLAGRPSNASVEVPNGIEATVLEIQRPALRLLRKLKTFETRLDYLYRQHGLGNTLQDIQEGSQNAFTVELLERLKKNSSFIV